MFRCFPSTIMLVKCLAIVFLAALAVAKVPSFIKTCGRRNPNLEKCMLDSTNALRDKIKKGIPEMGLQPYDPLYIDEFILSNSDSLKAFGRNVTITGLGDFIADKMTGDLKGQRFDTVMRFPKIIIDGAYDVSSKIIIPISARGPVHIEADDVATEIVMKYKLIKINGVDHIHHHSVTTSLTIKKWTAVLSPTPTMDSTLIKAIQAAMEGSREEIFETIKPNIEQVISKVTMDIANKVNEKYTFDELFPDTE